MSAVYLLLPNLPLIPFWPTVTQNSEGNGTPLQYSYLENPMDGGAWWAAVHGVAESQTQLSDFPFTFHFHALEKEMATHSSVLAWIIPGTGEPGGLPTMGSHRVGHNWSDLVAAAATQNNMGNETWGNVSNLTKLAQSKHHTQIVIFLQKVFTFFLLLLNKVGTNYLNPFWDGADLKLVSVFVRTSVSH